MTLDFSNEAIQHAAGFCGLLVNRCEKIGSEKSYICGDFELSLGLEQRTASTIEKLHVVALRLSSFSLGNIAGELRRIKKAVDPRHFSALAAQAKEATFFEAIEGYPSWRAAGALVSTRKRLALAMGCSEADIARRFEDGIRRPVDARLVSDGPCQEVVWQGDAVDLTAIPLPLMHRRSVRHR